MKKSPMIIWKEKLYMKLKGDLLMMSNRRDKWMLKLGPFVLYFLALGFMYLVYNTRNIPRLEIRCILEYGCLGVGTGALLMVNCCLH